MREILPQLDDNSWLLDLGCGSGSFQGLDCHTILVDVDRPSCIPNGPFVLADASRLPIRDSSINAVVSNHSLEHIERFDHALREIGRVLKDDGSIFISVPDASTFTDVLYRWLASGGGHVNNFTDLQDLIARIESRTGFRHVGTRRLFSSLSFLNRTNNSGRRPRKLLLLGGGREWTLRLYTLLSRLADRLLGTRTSLYGWALYFGNVSSAIDSLAWCNVCVRCGSATPAKDLLRARRVYRRWLFLAYYRCPECSSPNVFMDDEKLAHIK